MDIEDVKKEHALVKQAEEAYKARMSMEAEVEQARLAGAAMATVTKVEKVLGVNANGDPDMGVARIGALKFRVSRSSTLHPDLQVTYEGWARWVTISDLADLGRALADPPPSTHEMYGASDYCEPPVEERTADALERIANVMESVANALCEGITVTV